MEAHRLNGEGEVFYLGRSMIEETEAEEKLERIHLRLSLILFLSPLCVASRDLVLS